MLNLLLQSTRILKTWDGYFLMLFNRTVFQKHKVYKSLSIGSLQLSSLFYSDSFLLGGKKKKKEKKKRGNSTYRRIIIKRIDVFMWTCLPACILAGTTHHLCIMLELTGEANTSNYNLVLWKHKHFNSFDLILFMQHL